ncbi:Hypothetical protein IALB_3045 [Ignavibacterium album JCM 16511]|uniref:Mor transcription activator domain-containing protein n=1 Tax=Ignavibacterium album (strain DSM 19864 / JCM 16511 / NBRC 101810 / Mat9-16) TaxID=945713 RepID=I0AP41_IGNAJ|nr:hypothetical protein [Ignavibacterium album]AFH50748.1 Hypothetical protein IALB_3045 [Ignavibacterium album JCM 16511]
MDWIKDIDFNKFLDGDLKLLIEIVGVEKFIELYRHFAKTAIYFSEKPLMEMKQEYIRKNFRNKSEKELARMLGVSERLVYKIGSMKVRMNDQGDLFDE